MRITDIREAAVPLNSKLRNSSFDFSEMTTSVVAVITDVVRDGSRVVGSVGDAGCSSPAAKVKTGVTGARGEIRLWPHLQVRLKDEDASSLVRLPRHNIAQEISAAQYELTGVS